MAFSYGATNMFWKYKQEAERLGQEDGLGKWADRPLEVTSNEQPKQASASPIRNTTPFSQRKAKNQQLQEVSNLTPTTATASPIQSDSQQHNTNSDRPRDNISTSTRQEPERSSSKPCKQPFSSKYKRKE